MSETNIYVTFPQTVDGDSYTVLHKIFYWKSNIIPFADGKVRGTVENSFQLDEHLDILRIATTLLTEDPDYSSVYCLDYFLNELGSVSNIAPGERIFSARFVVNRLYLVTFERIDPFFVIGLDDPTKP